MRIFSFFCLLLLLFISTAMLPAQGLEQTNGPEGGTVYCIEQVGNAVWVGTNNGIYSSVDEGVTWHQEPLARGRNVFQLVAHNDSLLALTQVEDQFLLFRSTGSLAQADSFAPPGEVYLLANTMVYQQGKILFFAFVADTASLLVSPDFGATWSPAASLCKEQLFTYSMATDSFCLTVAYSQADTGTWVAAISTDGFATWQTLSTQAESLVGFAGNVYWKDAVLLIRNSKATMLKSVDYGKTWTNLAFAYDSFWPSADNESLFATQNGQIYKSIDAGTTWTAFSGNYTTHDGYFGLTLIEMNSNIIKYQNELKIINKNTNSEIYPYHGIVASEVQRIRVLGKRIFVTSQQKLYLSVDQGESWHQVAGIFNSGYKIEFFSDPYDSLHLFRYYYGNLAESYDNGFTWAAVSGNFEIDGSYSRSQDKLYATSYSSEKINILSFDSICHVATFNISSYNLPQSNDQYLAIGYCNDSAVFIASNYGNKPIYIFNGKNALLTPLSPPPLTDSNALVYFRQINDTAFAMLTTNGKLWVTYDAGKHWQAKHKMGLPIINGDTLLPSYLTKWKNKWIGHIYHYGLYQSDDEGEHWQLIRAELPFALTHMATMGNTLFFASMNAGVWRTDSTILAPVSPAGGFQLQYTLFPNPVRDRLSVRTSGPVPASSVLIITDMTGREQFRTPLAGAETELALPSLPGGLYLCRVVAGGKVLATGRVVME